MNGLTQVLLKAAAPGVPDFYQGSELWDLSLVDPDNRRAVDWEDRARRLRRIRAAAERDPRALVRELRDRWPDGRIKLFLTWRALSVRRAHPELFRSGDYLPLEATAARRRHVLAFARRQRGAWVLVVTPRLVAGLFHGRRAPLGRKAWGGAGLILPHRFPAQWRDVLSGESRKVARRAGRAFLPLHLLFRDLPVALLVAESNPTRNEARG